MSTDADTGCYVQGVMTIEGEDMICDIQPVSESGLMSISFPMSHPNNRIELVAADGIEVLEIVFARNNEELEGGYEFD